MSTRRFAPVSIAFNSHSPPNGAAIRWRMSESTAESCGLVPLNFGHWPPLRHPLTTWRKPMTHRRPLGLVAFGLALALLWTPASAEDAFLRKAGQWQLRMTD